MDQIGPMPVYPHTGVIDQRLTGLCYVALHQVGRVVVTRKEKHEQNRPEASYGAPDMIDTRGTTKSVAIQTPLTSRSEDGWLSRRKDPVIPSPDYACDGEGCV